MFKRILIAEDLDGIGLSLQTVISNFLKADIETSKYCDEAYLKVKRAMLDSVPYDLLITDLSFKIDHRPINISSGEDLIKAVKETQPNIKVLAYSIEDKPYKIKYLFKKYKIDGYICKGRDSLKEFEKAIEVILKDENYISPYLSNILNENNPFEIDENDVAVLRYLMDGLQQEEISEKFKLESRSGSSRSSIEKRVNKLKIFFQAKTNIQLVSIAKDMGII